MDYKSKLNRHYEIEGTTLYDCNGWALKVCEDITGKDVQSLIDEWESGKIGCAFMTEVKRYENDYSYKDGQIGLTSNEDETTSFIFSGKSARNGAEWWDYQVFDYVKDDDVFIQDFSDDVTKTFLVKSADDVINFLYGKFDRLTEYDRPIDYCN